MTLSEAIYQYQDELFDPKYIFRIKSDQIALDVARITLIMRGKNNVWASYSLSIKDTAVEEAFYNWLDHCGGGSPIPELTGPYARLPDWELVTIPQLLQLVKNYIHTKSKRFYDTTTSV